MANASIVVCFKVCLSLYAAYRRFYLRLRKLRRLKLVRSLKLSAFITFTSIVLLQSICCQLVLWHLTWTSIDLLTSTLQQYNPAAHFTWHPQPLHSKCTLQLLLFYSPFVHWPPLGWQPMTLWQSEQSTWTAFRQPSFDLILHSLYLFLSLHCWLPSNP